MTANDALHDDLATAYGRHLERRRAQRRKLRVATVAGVGALVVASAAFAPRASSAGRLLST